VDFKTERSEVFKHEDPRAWCITDLGSVLYEPVGGVIVGFNYLSF